MNQLKTTIPPEQERHLSWLDALKGLAILGVVMTHTVGGSLPGLLGPLGDAGEHGVQLFFVVSGYTAWLSLSRRAGPDGRLSPQAALVWFGQRLRRLLPLYYLALAAVLLLEGWGNRYWMGQSLPGVTAGNLLAHLTLTFGFFPRCINSILNVEWYLADLVLFYALAPFVFRLVRGAPGALLFFWGSVALSNLLPQLLPCPLPAEDSYVWSAFLNVFCLPAQLPVLALGVLVFYLCTAPAPARRPWGYALFASAVLLLADRAGLPVGLLRLTDPTLWGLFFALLVVSQHIFPCPVLDNPLFRFFGRVSYPVYLFHFLILDYFTWFFPVRLFAAPFDLFLIWLAVTTLSGLCGVCLLRWFDTPIQRLLSRARHGR